MTKEEIDAKRAEIRAMKPELRQDFLNSMNESDRVEVIGKPFTKGNLGANGQVMVGHRAFTTAGRPKKGYSALTSVKKAFVEAFHSVEVGGTQGLINWAILSNDNRTTFYKLMVQLIPKDLKISSDEDSPVATKVIIEVRDASGEPDDVDNQELIIDGEAREVIDETVVPDDEVERLAEESGIGEMR